MTEPVTPARINFGWLILLRFATITGQAIAIAIVRFGLRLPIALAPLAAVVAVEAASNVAALVLARRRTPSDAWLFSVMAFDVVAFSVLLFFTGGPENPFSFLYLVPISMASIMLRAAWTWVLVVLSLGSSAFLYLDHRPLPVTGSHAEHMSLHLRGMWIAFGVAAAFIVYFLMHVRRALASRDAELEASRSLAARQERLASLATLAAGAAHELATPLSTIAVVAKELERQVAAAGLDPDDARLMRDEVERCRRILSRMRIEAGDPSGERFARVSVRDLLADCLADERPDPGVTLSVDEATADAAASLPRHAFTQALRGLLDNARQASPAGAAVALRVAADPERHGVVFEIADRGAGIPAGILDRVGEPFFTTKPAGHGMGLGVFLARAIVERVGGELVIASAPGAGTTARVWLPRITP